MKIENKIISLLEKIPSELDSSEEINRMLDFILKYFQDKYGFEGIGVQVVDYENNIIYFYKLYIPSIEPEKLETLYQLKIPNTIEGGISAFVAQNNLTLYFQNIKEYELEKHKPYIAEVDRFSLELLNHITHLILPVVFENRVVIILHLSSFTKMLVLSETDIEDIKKSFNYLGRALYKTLSFKKLYEENKKLAIDILRSKEMRDSLLAGINHELKTPLNAIIGFSDYLSKIKQIDINRLHKIADIILKNGKMLLSLIQEIIELYKINTGKITLHYENIHIISLVKSIVENLSAIYYKKNHQIELKIENFDFFCDKQKLTQILNNLISNAMKYSDNYTKIIIRVFKQEEEAVFEIIDNGIGLDEEEKENLFIPFKRGKRGIEKEEGSGLGLYITHEIVKILGGRIEVQSVKNQGSTFTVFLPLQKENT